MGSPIPRRGATGGLSASANVRKENGGHSPPYECTKLRRGATGGLSASANVCPVPCVPHLRPAIRPVGTSPTKLRHADAGASGPAGSRFLHGMPALLRDAGMAPRAGWHWRPDHQCERLPGSVCAAPATGNSAGGNQPYKTSSRRRGGVWPPRVSSMACPPCCAMRAWHPAPGATGGSSASANVHYENGGHSPPCKEVVEPASCDFVTQTPGRLATPPGCHWRLVRQCERLPGSLCAAPATGNSAGGNRPYKTSTWLWMSCEVTSTDFRS